MTNAIQGFGVDPSLSSSFGNSTTVLLGILDWIWKICRGFILKYSKKGMYEVLDFQTKLTIHDPKGKNATLTKYEKVRFLQDNIIAYQDQAWGMEKFYRITNARPVFRSISIARGIKPMF